MLRLPGSYPEMVSVPFFKVPSDTAPAAFSSSDPLKAGGEEEEGENVQQRNGTEGTVAVTLLSVSRTLNILRYSEGCIGCI